MAKGFGNLKGEAQKSNVKYMKLADGDNVFRILPDSVLPGYDYWIKGATGKSLPFPALQYDREEEKFDNSRACPVREAGLKTDDGKDVTCKWAYKCHVINKATGLVEVLQLKKGMLADISTLAQDLEVDPSDLEDGFWVTVTRVKTGPKVFNVEYKLRHMKCTPSPLEDEYRELLTDLKSMEELFPVETYEKQKERLHKHLTGAKEVEEDATDTEAVDELDN